MDSLEHNHRFSLPLRCKWYVHFVKLLHLVTFHSCFYHETINFSNTIKRTFILNMDGSLKLVYSSNILIEMSADEASCGTYSVAM